MNLDERNEKILEMRCEGATLSQIAREFDISSERVRRICLQKKERIEIFDKWPPLKSLLPARVQNVFSEPFKEIILVGVILKDLRPLDPPGDDVMQSPRCVNS